MNVFMKDPKNANVAMASAFPKYVPGCKVYPASNTTGGNKTRKKNFTSKNIQSTNWMILDLSSTATCALKSVLAWYVITPNTIPNINAAPDACTHFDFNCLNAIDTIIINTIIIIITPMLNAAVASPDSKSSTETLFLFAMTLCVTFKTISFNSSFVCSLCCCFSLLLVFVNIAVIPPGAIIGLVLLLLDADDVIIRSASASLCCCCCCCCCWGYCLPAES